MSLYDEILKKTESISVIGLGYVGMPIAVEFAKTVNVIGYDINEDKINLYRKGVDPTNEVGNEIISNTTVLFTSNESDLKNSRFHIIAVPTPINLDKTPNLLPVISASEILGRNLTHGSYVVYESTVYPGVTESICIPILENKSGMKCGIDFFVGYSPERINPGDKVHRLDNIVKIVSAQDEESLEVISNIYEIVVKVGVHKVSSIKVAEAAKVVENSQRDINIAFMNELALVFDRMDIDTKEVVDAMNTKWNALGFSPGLVGGHCIGVDPYYFIYEAEKLGYHSQIILSGRKINDSIGRFIGESVIKKLILAGKKVREAKIVILGMSFKENCPDTRNSKVIDVFNSLIEYGVKPIIVDPQANKEEAKVEYNIEIVDLNQVTNADCLIFAVAHNEFVNMTIAEIDSLFCKTDNKEKVLIDVKSIFNKEEIEEKGYSYWRL